MKFFVLFLLLVAPAFSADKPKPSRDRKGAVKKPAPAKNPMPSAESQIPKGATKISDYQWRYVDKDGKAWIYKQTPFGVAKLPEEQMAEDQKRAAANTSGMEAREIGDSIEFSKRTPFGVNTWTKKKTELDEAEKAAWESASHTEPRPSGSGKK